MRVVDRTGLRYGQLEVLAQQESSVSRSKWACKCDCGNIIEALGYNLESGNTTSCGCIRKKHGMSKTKIYSAWRQMRQRCENQKDASYANYGGRGIEVSLEWKDFDVFYKDMGDPPYGHTLDRIDNNGSYSKENCRWASWREQHANKRTNRILEAFGKTQTLQQWADEYKMPLTTLRNRLDRAEWPVELALTKPINLKKSTRL